MKTEVVASWCSNSASVLKRISTIFCICLMVAGCWVPDTYEFKGTLGQQGKKAGEFYGLQSMVLMPLSEEKIVTLEAKTLRGQVLALDGASVGVIAEKVENALLRMKAPVCIAVHPSQLDIAIADNALDKIFINSHTGQFRKVVQGIPKPRGIAYGDDGKLYIVSLKETKIHVFSIGASGGKLEKTIGGKQENMLYGPVAICIKNKKIYVLEEGSRRVTVMDMEGAILLRITDKADYGEFLSPSGIDVDEAGNIYVSDTGEIPCAKFSPEGKFISKIGTNGDQKGELMKPVAICVTKAGAVLIADGYLNQIQLFKQE